jgi:hypothetical protein
MALTMLGLSAGVAAVASVNPCPRLISAAGAGAAAVSLENPNSVTPPGRITYAIASLVSSGLIVVVGHFLHFDFIAIVFAGMFIGRNIAPSSDKQIRLAPTRPDAPHAPVSISAAFAPPRVSYCASANQCQAANMTSLAGV